MSDRPRASRSTRQSHDDAGVTQLRDLLRKRAKHLNESALASHGEVAASEIDSLERLSRLVQLCDELKPPPKRWPPILALLIALSAVSALLLIHVPQTQISLDAEVSELSFVLPSEKPVVGRTRVSQLGVSGADAIHLSPDLIQTFNASSHSDSPLNIRLTAVTNSSSSGAINTAALIPPPGTRVWLCFMGPSNAYRLSLKAPQNAAPVALQADARGEVEMAAPGLLDRPRVLDFGKSGGSVQFEANKDVMDVDFELIDTADWQFYAQVPIQHLEFTRIDEFTTPEGSLVAPMSTLLGGALYLESLTGEKRELRAGERLQFSSSIGRIETLRLENGRILVKFRGRVAGMKIGDDSTSRNLMPNLLEWLKARQPLSLLWGATVFVYGIAASVMRWYQRSP